MRHPASMSFVLLLVSAATAIAKDVTVKVGHDGFTPSTVTIGTRDTVIFSNTQEMPCGHTIVSDDGSFSSPPLGKNASWSHPFERPGTYKVHVKEHPGTVGEVIVK